MIFKNKTKNFRSGFTLVEILVVLAIIGIITGIATISVSTIRQKSRDIKRLKEIDSVRAALQMYFYNEGQYPNSITFGSTLMGSSSSSTYMALLPNNPSPKNDGACPDSEYTYSTTATSTSYKIDFCLSTPVGNVSSGQKCATPQGVLDQSCFVCGDNFSYGGQSYATTLIGSQCWLADNLNVGTQICSVGTTCATDPDDTFSLSAIEKYCYENNLTYCSNYGALYSWTEMMGLPNKCNDNNYDCSTNPAVCDTDDNDCDFTIALRQGVCPTGWHVSTLTEIQTLAQNADPGCSITGGTCTTAGGKITASSGHTPIAWNGTDIYGFSAVPASFRATNGSFSGLGSYDVIWTATPHSYPYYSYFIDLDGTADVVAAALYRTMGASVRCVKN